MKKIIFVSAILMLASSFAFTQAQDPGFSNTIYTGVGTGSMINPPKKGQDEKVQFEGFVNYFTANLKAANGLTIAGDIAWTVFPNGSASAKIHEWNFNAIMSPITNLDLGVGTNLDWEIGPKPFSGPSYASYEVPESAGLGIFGNSVSTVMNYFAEDALAARYSFEDTIIVGAALNGGITGSTRAGLGVHAKIEDLFTLGFAYNGSFGSTGNNIYLGSSIYALDGFDLDVWTNFDINNSTSLGGRILFYKDGFRLTPEYTITFWNAQNKGVSMFAAIVAEMSISDEVLAGINASWGLGSDADTTSDFYDSGARLNVSPHVVWNISDNNRLSAAINLMPVWWQTGDVNEFFWSIPVSWRVSF